ncbi:MAG: transcriptional regulator [Polaromonas sp.]|nr:transcriptional regulator [Polaromonas sp.]
MPIQSADSTVTVTTTASKRPAYPYPSPAGPVDPELEALVREIIGRVADKWTMLALEGLAEHGRLRFTRLGELIGGVSQKMLTKTLRQMEADGLVLRTVYPVVPPRVEYELTAMGLSLGAAFCGVWIWAEEHRAAIMKARQDFADRDQVQAGFTASLTLPVS